MENIDEVKKFGVGTMSFFISILAIIFTFTIISGKTVGEYILDAINISFSVEAISLILLSVAAFIGYKYKKHYLAKSGLNISVVFIILMFILSTLSAYYQ